ncbi:DUF2189 domain-containing protein [Flavobacterium soyangense]|uniref:Beta-carotene 15,15'-monooxygenase n=1 Tax=Flavobacterium soyangense TaxID=2023265 RepID=A0A930UBD3_9FLAO|nr:hypothetical protein [Flavobacterium soyangense]MBF2709012.1 hypothetical protein [Flavobacterium soyangense]
MKSVKERIEDIRINGYELDFGTVFENAFKNYKKIALYAGLILLFFFIFMIILMSVGMISYIGIENMEAFSKKLIHFSELKEKPLDIVIQINAVTILLSGLLNPFMAGFLKMADCGEKDEEFHVSTMFSYYKSPYFSNIFIAVFIITLVNMSLTTLLEFVGFNIIGSLISLTISFLTFLTIPFIIFGKLNSIDAIKSSIIIVSKQPLILLGLIIVSLIAAMIGIFGFCIGMLFTMPFVYSMNYMIYKNIIGIDSISEIEEIANKEI